jgi:hypothetical protein
MLARLSLEKLYETESWHSTWQATQVRLWHVPTWEAAHLLRVDMESTQDEDEA